MILDKETLFADGLAHGGTPAVLQMGDKKPGPGQPIKCFITGSADLAGCTGFKITDGATSGAATNDLLEITENPAGKTIEFNIPSNVDLYATIALVGTTSAGTFTAGVVLPGVQTNY